MTAIEGKMNAYIWWIQIYYSLFIYWEELMRHTFLFFDLLWWSMYLGHTMPYSPSIHFHFGIPTTGPTKNVAEVRRTVGPVLEAQRLQGDSNRTLRWLGRFMRESKPWTYTKFQWEIVQKYSKIKKHIGFKTILSKRSWNFAYGILWPTGKNMQVSGCQERFGPICYCNSQ